jgi:hypothetical protein
MNITIKDVPKPVYQRLKKAAAQSGRSMNKFVIYTLERTLFPVVRKDRAELLESIRRQREAMPFSLDVETMQRYIDEGRE